MMDFAVNTCNLEPDEYFIMFIISGIAAQIEKGNPKYTAGMTGCEIVKNVIYKSGLSAPEYEDIMYIDKSPEYWSGWALAYYQWHTGRTFENIHKVVSMKEVIAMYPTLHEADISKFIDIINRKISTSSLDTKLKRMRINAGLSQNELAKCSGINIRQIQMFEQKQRDINKSCLQTVQKLAKGLGCQIEDLIEP